MNKLSIIFLIFCCISCTPQAPENTKSVSYFDIENFFNTEVSRLTAANPTVHKEVIVAGKKEQKSVKISDWKTELAMFLNSAINKDSWREEFQIGTNNNATTYTTANPKIPIKQVTIFKNGGKVSEITIYRMNENYLYSATDTLIYLPDSSYQIKSYQKIKLLDAKEYQVIGKFAK